MAKDKKDPAPNKKVTIRKNKKTIGVEYKFNTDDGFLSVGPEDIVEALKELSEHNNEAIGTNTDIMDLQGWSVIHGKDQNGKVRPLFLMRAMPIAGACARPTGSYAEDNEKIYDIAMKQVYHLTPLRIKWISFKNWISHHLTTIAGKIKGTEQ